MNLEGVRFGKLVVLEKTNKRRNKSIVWKCKCDCGNIQYFSTKQLRSDGVIQCSVCGNNRCPKNNLTENIIGKIFGKLTVLSKTNEKRKNDSHILYICKCDCGNIIKATRTELKSGHTLSCGCRKIKYSVGDIVNNREIIGFFGNINSRFYYKCKCLNCGNIYLAMGQTLETTISCGCLKSVGEFKISKLLNEENVSYIKEYSFPNSKYRFDFAIIDSNKTVIRLIEFDGEQHFCENIKNSGWNTIEHYKKVVHNDLKKNIIAKNHNIPLIRIPYWERYNIDLNMLLGDMFLVN